MLLHCIVAAVIMHVKYALKDKGGDILYFLTRVSNAESSAQHSCLGKVS